MVTVVETVTVSSTVPATSMVAPGTANERAWLMVADGAATEHELVSFPLTDTNNALAAPAGFATTIEATRLSTPTARASMTARNCHKTR